MEGFRNFTSAMDRASDFSTKWISCDDFQIYTYPEMMLLAAHLDINDPLEDRLWYIVFPDGEICMLHEDFDEIMPLFKPLNKDKIEKKFTGDEFYPPERTEKKTPKEKKGGFCIYCGTRLTSEAVYCPECGKKVKS